MAVYVATEWAKGDKITAEKLNKIEEELVALSTAVEGEDAAPAGGGAE